MNPWSYPDPGQTTNRTAWSGDVPSPPGDWTSRAGQTLSDLSGFSDYLAAIQELKDNPGTHFQERGPATSRAIADMVGNIAQPGMIRWAPGKEYRNAMLHRNLGNPEELNWWSKIFQRGESSQKPTSLVTPSILQTYQSEPYGLLFNVNEPNQIKHTAYGDVWTDGKLRLGLNNSIGEGNLMGEDWIPTRYPERLVNPEEQPLEDLIGKLGQATRKWGEGQHSEVIPEIDRSMLAGVRLPMHKPGNIPDEFASELGRYLRNFAEQQHVPIYRWPAVETSEQAIKGLSGDPFRGKWGWKPGTREYKTSSQLPEIFGIRELP